MFAKDARQAENSYVMSRIGVLRKRFQKNADDLESVEELQKEVSSMVALDKTSQPDLHQVLRDAVLAYDDRLSQKFLNAKPLDTKRLSHLSLVRNRLQRVASSTRTKLDSSGEAYAQACKTSVDLLVSEYHDLPPGSVDALVAQRNRVARTAKTIPRANREIAEAERKWLTNSLSHIERQLPPRCEISKLSRSVQKFTSLIASFFPEGQLNSFSPNENRSEQVPMLELEIYRPLVESTVSHLNVYLGKVLNVDPSNWDSPANSMVELRELQSVLDNQDLSWDYQRVGWSAIGKSHQLRKVQVILLGKLFDDAIDRSKQFVLESQYELAISTLDTVLDKYSADINVLYRHDYGTRMVNELSRREGRQPDGDDSGIRTQLQRLAEIRASATFLREVEARRSQ